MDIFTISQLEQFSGIKAHTIRVWERRYNALDPIRSEGNTRYYNGSQLRRLLNLVSLMDSDLRVSELCSMSDEQLAEMLRRQLKDQSASGVTDEYFVSQLIAAGMGYDEVHFEKIFSHCILRLGLADTYVRIIYPVLERVGLMWGAGIMPPACEHFISNLFRQKLFTAIDALPPAKEKAESWMLFLPENEFHETGLLFASYLIKKAGNKVFYLGSNVPLQTLEGAVKSLKPDNLMFFMVHYDVPGNSGAYISELRNVAGKARLHFSGNEKLIGQIKAGAGIHWVKTVSEMKNLLK